MDVDELVKKYQTGIDLEKPQKSKGLAPQIAERLLKEYGPNTMSPPKTESAIVQWLRCILNMFNVLLIVSGVLCYLLLIIDPSQNVRVTFFKYLEAKTFLELYWCYSYQCCYPQRYNRVRPDSQKRKNFGLFYGHGSSTSKGHSGRSTEGISCSGTCAG
jgi:hypothetical protein